VVHTAPELERGVGRLGEAVQSIVDRDARREQEADLRALRDLPRVMTAMKRGLVVTLVRNGLFHTAIPREAWSSEGFDLKVRCNCGAEHTFPEEVGAVSDTFECGRAFLYDGVDVRVTKRPE
jgi:hypothetical protein